MAVRSPSGEGSASGVGTAALPSEPLSAADWSPLGDLSVARGRRGWVVRRLLLVADLAGLLLAFAVAEILFVGQRGPVSGLGVGFETVVFLVTLPGWVVGAKLYGLYDRDSQNADHTTADEFPSIFHFVTVAVWLFFAGSWITGLTNPTQPKLATFWLLAIAGITGFRVAARAIARRRPSYIQNAIIVGAGDVGQLLARKLLNHAEYGINLVGFVDSSPKDRREDLGDLTLLGPLESVPALVRELEVERVMIAYSNESHSEILDAIRSLKDLEVQIDIVPRFFEIVGPRLNINSVEGLAIVSIPPLRLPRSSRLMKRGLDLTLAATGVFLLTPFMALVALLIKLDSRGPVLFAQVRMGANDRTFSMLKFRTMIDGADLQKATLNHLNKHANGDSRMFKIPGDPRVTKVGRVLRRFSLDELPQLFNVIRGEMSLVGPRPLVLNEDEFVASWGRRRLSLRPGMTGVWQILGRTDIPFDEMVKLDYLYVTNWTLSGDLKILARTIPAIVRPQDAY